MDDYVGRPGQEAALGPEVMAGLRALAGDDEAFVTELAATFVASAGEHVMAMRAALAAAAAVPLHRAAHSLKGSSAQIGARRLAEACGALEQQAAHGSLVGAPALLERIARELEPVSRVLAARAGGAVA